VRVCQEGDRLVCRFGAVVAPGSTLSLPRHHYLLGFNGTGRNRQSFGSPSL